MIIYSEYSVDEVFSAMDMSVNSRVMLADGNSFKKNSQRLQLFRKNLVCVDCGITGNSFVLETHHRDIKPHLNLYAVMSGEKILITKDHIHPRSKGGSDSMDNYQTMCAPCNSRKGSTVV